MQETEFVFKPLSPERAREVHAMLDTAGADGQALVWDKSSETTRVSDLKTVQDRADQVNAISRFNTHYC
jgi:hypothetical protein